MGARTKLMIRRPSASPRALYDTESVLPRLYSPKGDIHRLGWSYDTESVLPRCYSPKGDIHRLGWSLSCSLTSRTTKQILSDFARKSDNLKS